MPTKAQVQKKRTTISKIYIVVLLVLFLLASIKWIRNYVDPTPRPEPDSLDNVTTAAEVLLVPMLLFGIGLLMFTSGIFASIGVALMVAGAVMFGFALYNVIKSVKEAAIDFVDPINPFAR
jgi:hypothetical protein